MGRTKGAKNREPQKLTEEERERRRQQMRDYNAKKRAGATSKPTPDDKPKDKNTPERGFFDRLFDRS